MVHIAIDIDESEKRRFKVLCAEHGDTMSEVLKKGIRDYVSSKNVHIVKS